MYITVDIGGTKTLLATFSDEGQPIEQVKFPTPPVYADFKSALAQAASQLTPNQYHAGGVGVRGNIDRNAGTTLMDDVLTWGVAPVRTDCESVFGCSFVLENDSKLAGLSEAIALNGEFSKVLYITISTGIGSALIVNGVLDEDTVNSEIGKSLFEHEGSIQCWEDFASGKAIVARYGKRAGDLEDPEAWRKISQNIAIGMINAIASFTPEIIVIGGGVGSHYNAKFKQPLEDAITQLIPVELPRPVIRQALHPEEAVIYGCFAIARSHHGHSTNGA